MATKVKSRIFGGLFRNRNSWNDKNNPSFSGLSWLQTCQNQLTVSLWRLYSHSGIRVARERAIVWLFPTIPILEYAPQKHALKRLKYLVYTGLVYKQYFFFFFYGTFDIANWNHVWQISKFGRWRVRMLSFYCRLWNPKISKHCQYALTLWFLIVDWRLQ